jgi:PAS domain S-box-containing protein
MILLQPVDQIAAGPVLQVRSAWNRNKAALARSAPAGSAVPTVVTLRFCREGPARGSSEQEPLLGKDDGGMKFGEGEPSAFHAAIEMSLVPIVLCDPHQPDCPIVFANGAFCELTGYDVTEIVGRNCRFLQGPATDRKAVARVRSAVAARWNITEELANYRKDGSLFWNALFVNPVFDRGGRLAYLFGTQLDVTHRRTLEGALQRSHELLSVAQSAIAEALALPLNEAQRERLHEAGQALGEAARHQLPLLPKGHGGGSREDSGSRA